MDRLHILFNEFKNLTNIHLLLLRRLNRLVHMAIIEVLCQEIVMQKMVMVEWFSETQQRQLKEKVQMKTR